MLWHSAVGAEWLCCRWTIRPLPIGPIVYSTAGLGENKGSAFGTDHRTLPTYLRITQSSQQVGSLGMDGWMDGTEQFHTNCWF